MTSYQEKESYSYHTLNVFSNKAFDKNNINNNSKNETKLDKNIKKTNNKIISIGILESEKIEKSKGTLDSFLANNMEEKYPVISQNDKLKEINIYKVNDNINENFHDITISREQKLKNLPITTCMKKINYDYEGKNNLNSQISINNKEMEIDNAFSNLLFRVKEKKEKNVEPKKFSELSFNNYVNKGPLKFFNVVVNRKIPENQCSSAFPSNKNRILNRSSHSSIKSNVSNDYIINKKINNEKTKLIKNKEYDKIIEESKLDCLDLDLVNKNSIYNSEKDLQQIEISTKNSDYLTSREQTINNSKNSLDKLSISMFQGRMGNNNVLLSSPKRMMENKKSDDEINIENYTSKKIFFSNLEKEKNKSYKDIDQQNNKRIDVIKDDAHLIRENKKKLSQNFDLISKNNNLNGSPSNETTNTHSQNSPVNSSINNINSKPITKPDILNIDKEEFDFLRKKRNFNSIEKEAINPLNINKKSSKFNSMNTDEIKGYSKIINSNLIEPETQNSESIHLSLSEKRTHKETKPSVSKMNSIHQMFNQCLSKSASANFNSELYKKSYSQLDCEISPSMETNSKPFQDFKFYDNKKDEDFSKRKDSDFYKNKERNVESEIDSYILDISESKRLKSNEFNPNYKVESSLNVNVNLVTYPNYFANSNNDDKVSLNKNQCMNIEDSTDCYSNNFQKFRSTSSYPATNISNFANININNTLPQILINPSTNRNNLDIKNNLNNEFKGKINKNENDNVIRNSSFDKKIIRESLKHKSLSSLKTKDNRDYSSSNDSLDILGFKNLLKLRKITFQEIHHALHYQLKFIIDKTNSCFEITIDNDNSRILNLINYDTKIGQRVIEIKNINSDTNEVISFNINKIKNLLSDSTHV